MKSMKFHIQTALMLMLVTGFAATARAANVQPGQLWRDTAGKPIDAHGGCVIFHDGIYYWYGTHKIEGLSEKTHADGGVHVYASRDLVKWHDQGMVLRLDGNENPGPDARMQFRPPESCIS